MHVPTGRGRDRSRDVIVVVIVVVVTSTAGHGSWASGGTAAGATGRAGPVVRRRRATQLELTVFLDWAEYVGNRERCRVRGVMVVMVVMVRFGAQRHR